MIADCTAIILAGGDSQRMGRDKANLLLGEQTMLQRVIATMQLIFTHVTVSVRQPRPEINLPQICDTQTIAGPLAGMIAGLGSITTPWAFVVACDMPFIVPEVVEYLAQQRSGHQAVVPVVQGHLQTLSAFYARDCLGAVRTHLATGGKNSMRAVLDLLRVRYVDEAELLKADLALRSFFDLDTPQDVALAMSGDAKT